MSFIHHAPHNFTAPIFIQSTSGPPSLLHVSPMQPPASASFFLTTLCFLAAASAPISKVIVVLLQTTTRAWTPPLLLPGGRPGLRLCHLRLKSVTEIPVTGAS